MEHLPVPSDMGICDEEEEEDGVCEREQEMLEKNGDISSTIVSLAQRSSPFASSDSLANDVKDHSDSIWNESQATVLHADSDNNGTGISCSDLSSLSALCPAVLSLTPSSRRKQLLLLQHQQRSSMDTEALDEEFDASQVPQGPPSPRLRVEGPQYPRPTFSVTTPSQDEPTEPDDAVVPNKRPSPLAEKLERVVTKPPRDVVMSPSQSRRALRRRRSPAGYRTPDSSTEQHSLESIDSLTRNNGSTADLLLGRTDSGKTGTDISETSTTEDYVTANDNNSGTDTSSRRSVSYHLPKDRGGGQGAAGVGGGSAGAGDCSSFESASSMYSLTRGELNSDELAQVCCSPPPIMEENSSDVPTTPQLESEDNQASTTPRVSIDMTTAQKKGSGHEGTSPSGDSSSSSGSYSVEGSSNDLDKLPPSTISPAPSADKNRHRAKGGSVSDEEHSGHYSSSGYYESPADGEEEAEGYNLGRSRTPALPEHRWKDNIRMNLKERGCKEVDWIELAQDMVRVSGGERREWTEEEKRKKKNAFKLDFSPNMDKEEIILQPTAHHHKHKDSSSETWSRRSSAKSDRSSGKSDRSSGKSERSGRSEAIRTPTRSPPDSEGSRKTTPSRRGKSRSRSPVQHHRRVPSTLPGVAQAIAKKAHRDKSDKEPITPGMVRSPAMHEGFRTEDWGTLQRTTPVHTPEEAAPVSANNIGTCQLVLQLYEQQHVDHIRGCVEHRMSPVKVWNALQPNNSHLPGDIAGYETVLAENKAPGVGEEVQQPPLKVYSKPISDNRTRRRSGSTEEKSAGSAATLARRRSSIPAKSPGSGLGEGTGGEDASAQSLVPKGSRLSPHRYSRSPASSPSRRLKSKGSPKMIADSSSKGTISPDSTRLKALSAESLRSVSPGSDSVFYSESADHSSNAANLTDNQGVLCHHCGREVDKSTLSGVEDGEGPCERVETEQPDIVQPPAGFADSPEGPRGMKPSSGRLYKKLEKRFRSEDRGGHGERRHHSRFRCEGVRAKSEERGKEDRVKVRPLARSTDASMEVLKTADSSPNMARDNSVSDLLTDDEEDQDTGIIIIIIIIIIINSLQPKPDTRADDKDDKSGDNAESTSIGVTRRGSSESTGSEKDFRRKYQAITHRMVHRKSSVEMYKRLQSKSFGPPRAALSRQGALSRHCWRSPQLSALTLHNMMKLNYLLQYLHGFKFLLLQQTGLLKTGILGFESQLCLVKVASHPPSRYKTDTSCCVHTSLHQALENILHQMLMVWCKQTLAIKVVSGENDAKIKIKVGSHRVKCTTHDLIVCVLTQWELMVKNPSIVHNFYRWCSYIIHLGVELTTPSDVYSHLNKSGSGPDAFVVTRRNPRRQLSDNPYKNDDISSALLPPLCGLMFRVSGYRSRSPGFDLGCFQPYFEAVECDKTVVVRRESGEFGFRIHGSRPVVVSAIEPDTPAETSGLEVGDIVISVNSVNVLEASHSEVVKLAHAGSDTLQLEVARTCNVLTPIVREPGAGSPLYSGYLWKLRTCDSGNNNRKWIERWFCLKRDNCLYYYKNDNESQPLGALMLANYTATRTPDSGRPYSFQVLRKGAAGLHLAADGEESATRWLAVVSHSIERNAQVSEWTNRNEGGGIAEIISNTSVCDLYVGLSSRNLQCMQMDEWLDISKRNLKLSPSAVQQPDCFGYLMKLGEKWKSWKRRYCVLKDACLFFYKDGTSDSALVMIPMINILVTIMIHSQGWCASMDTEFKTPPLAGKGLSLKFFHPNLDNDISTSTLTQRWTRNDGSLPSNTLSTVGLKSADASASDVQLPNTKKAKKLTKKQLRLSFDANAGPPHLEEERKLSLENGHHSYQLLAT
uniref:Uncharacterized protein n=1 Tax=Timema bartmani TaxID=61472 RepID=A0A7R9EYL3_9NEOP|nr:unnamed protein product [Timema bartmani]